MDPPLPRLSTFKLHLLDLISQIKHLREREQSARKDLIVSHRRRKEAEAEYERRFREMREELDARDDSVRKLEAKMRSLEDDNMLLERKHKELKDTMNELLQSREGLLKVSEDTTVALKHAIAARDRKLAALSDKLRAHLSLSESIEKEATALKHALHKTRQLVSGKEQVVVELKEKINRVSLLEKYFNDKICFFKSKLENYQEELQRKDMTISMMKEQLEAARDTSMLQSKIGQFQKGLRLKDETIENLTSEKQGLRRELQGMEVILQKIQGTVHIMDAEDKSCLMNMEEERKMVRGEETKVRNSNAVSYQEDSPLYNFDANSSEPLDIMLPQEQSTKIEHLSRKDVQESCLSETLVCSSLQSLSPAPLPKDSPHDKSLEANQETSTLSRHQIEPKNLTEA